MQYLLHSYLCRRRHKVALIAEQNLIFCPRFLRRKTSAEWRITMQVDTINSVSSKSADKDYDSVAGSVQSTPVLTTDAGSVQKVVSADTSVDTGAQGEENGPQSKDPSANTIHSVVSEANQKMRMSKTRCEYSYDEPTKRVSIKVYDKDTDELIREVPPEKSLEMLQKMWELAGIIVDEKR